MQTEITFLGESDEMVNAMRAIGLGEAGRSPVPLSCPYQVGDFISYPAAPQLAFRVVYRLFCEGDAKNPHRWNIGLEKAPHPLAPQAAGGLHPD